MRSTYIFSLAALRALLDVEGLTLPSAVMTLSTVSELVPVNGVFHNRSDQALPRHFSYRRYRVSVTDSALVTTVGQRLAVFSDVFSETVDGSGTPLASLVVRGSNYTLKQRTYPTLVSAMSVSYVASLRV